MAHNLNAGVVELKHLHIVHHLFVLGPKVLKLVVIPRVGARHTVHIRYLLYEIIYWNLTLNVEDQLLIERVLHADWGR